MRILMILTVGLLFVFSGCASKDVQTFSFSQPWYSDLDPTNRQDILMSDWAILDLDAEITRWPEDGFTELRDDLADFW